jgi:transcriptional regulator with XRE-family HTH domain
MSGRELRLWRTMAGKTQAYAAAYVGVLEQTWRVWEAGRHRVPVWVTLLRELDPDLDLRPLILTGTDEERVYFEPYSYDAFSTG